MYPQHQIQVAMLHFLTALVLYKVLFFRPRFVIHQSYSNELTKLRPGLHHTTITPANNNSNASLSTAAPLFYHISPGSTGSRTLYHASCSAGYPSVHHKSFCISNTRGINNVHKGVVDGVRAHFKVLRLYEMAARCTSLQQKGKLVLDEKESNTTMLTQSLCHTTVNEWAANLTLHLNDVIQSHLVGIFDTPYPYLAPQVLEYTKLCRHNTIIGITERNPVSWAKSRIKHGLLLCRQEYSSVEVDTTWGSSEFDVLGCISRASLLFKQQNHQQSNSSIQNRQRTKLYFWDVFWYRSHHEMNDDVDFIRGMEQQMTRHQRLYLPLATYTPDFFGVHTTKSNDKSSHHIDEKQVSKDISRLISKGNRKINTSKNMPLKCRGRVNWEIFNDSFVELYHLPKTCESNTEVGPIPLI